MNWKKIAQNNQEDIPAEIIAEAHEDNTHSEVYCSPETCEETAQSHATDHGICTPFHCDFLGDLHENGNHTECNAEWCQPRMAIDYMHSQNQHSVECNPQSCSEAAKKHELNDHRICGEDSACGIIRDWFRLGREKFATANDYDYYQSIGMDHNNPLNKVYPDRDFFVLSGFPGISKDYSVCFNCLDDARKDRGSLYNWDIQTHYINYQGNRATINHRYQVPFDWNTEEPGLTDDDEFYPSCDHCGETIHENPARLRTEAVKEAHDLGKHTPSACGDDYCLEVNRKHENGDHSSCSFKYCPVMQEYHKDKSHKNCTYYGCHIKQFIEQQHARGTHSPKCMPENCSDMITSHATDHKLCNNSFCSTVDKDHHGLMSHKLCSGYWCEIKSHIDRNHKAGTHSQQCHPASCEAMEKSHATDHVLCDKAPNKFCQYKRINHLHSLNMHDSLFCKPDTCETMAKSHATNHYDCSNYWCEHAATNAVHNLGMHGSQCKPDTCETMKKSHEKNHYDCYPVWCDYARKNEKLFNWLRLDQDDEE